MNFKVKYNEYLEKIEKQLEKYFEFQNSPQKTVYEAMRYSIFAGGKRIRPVLVLAVAEMLDGSIEEIMPLACSIEMIHTYSLIHDDLPAMDDDDLRRGRPTLHIKYDEAIAILAGDGLLNKAFETSLSNENIKAENIKNYFEALKILSNASGVDGMIAGQIIDMESENKKIDIDLLNYMHKKKTGALLKASVLMPSKMYCKDKSQYNSLLNYAEKIGLAFQIKDDILDVEGDSKILGKPQGSDSENNKSTYVSIYGLDKAKELLSDNIESALTSIKQYGDSSKFLEEIALYIYKRNT
jgi:geranylgeranyl diphosphate synthase type II